MRDTMDGNPHDHLWKETMAGQFELFADEAAEVRFRMIAPDGTVLAVSRPYPDTRSAAAGIEAMRECAGTGLISNLCPSVLEPVKARTMKTPAPSAVAQRAHRKGLCAA
jgi:uncharacterized protein YegP (UPF0339 family)